MAEIPPTRASLLVRLRDPHDEAAWREFVDLYAPLLYGYARKQGLQDADAADLTQDVLGAVAGAVGRLEYDPSRGAFRNWLFTIVRRRLSNWRVAQSRQVRSSGQDDQQQLLEQCPAPDPLDEEWETQWRQQVFAWACAQVRREVTASTWQAFWRTAVAGQRCKEVAAELEMSITAVYVARSRVLARLQELVQSAQEDV
jgi:RNA polymerase sigma-70 factor (ECF subfamily)